MRKYELVIFDLDGTLADTSEGIFNAHKYANAYMKRREPTEQELKNIIGAPLLDTYINVFKYKESEARKAIKVYRDWYDIYGVKEARLYDHIYEMLQVLHHKSYKLAVATLKTEILAKKVLGNLGIAQLFDLIHGVDTNDKLSKCDLINMCINELKCEKATSILVGDSLHDMAGALKAGIDFIGVTYGFGSFDDLQSSMVMQIDNPLEILDIF